MKTLLRIIVIPIFLIVAIIAAPFMLLRSSAFPRRKAAPPRPATMEEVQKAEGRLGFELPAELRSFFLERPPMRQNCAERYTLNEAVKEYPM